jgi:hypothetical protein
MIGEGKFPEVICEELLGYCLAPVCQMGGLGGDNMSIIIICFLHGKPWEVLVEKCKKIHADKRASTKLSEPAFSQFDRFTADGPFAEVSVLKAADDVHSADSTSSSSHTSSPSSSPISADEKFDALLAEGPVHVVKADETNEEESSKVTAAEEEETKETLVECNETSSKTSDDTSKTTEVAASTVDTPTDQIVSNGD